MSLLEMAEWLSATPWSIALHESLYVYPLIESVHVLAIGLFVGTLAIVDLRLLGVAFDNVPVSEVSARILPWTIAGFVLMVTTGVLLFYAIPVRTYQSLWFRVKVVLLIAAAVNAWWFHRRIERDRPTWDTAPRPPRRVRVAGATSLAIWAGVIVMGRMIAYNWFDCDRQPQPAFVNWFAGCVVDGELGVQ
jgi:hypothetical protein